MRKLLYIAGLPLMLIAASCTKQIPDYGATSTVKASNGWWANLYQGGAAVYPSPRFIATYNTAGNDSMWVDDKSHLYGIKCKTQIIFDAGTFSTKAATNAYYDGTPNFPATATITNGKVLPKAGHSKAGNLTDSLYMQIIFSDDPTTTYEIRGTARTGFIEDDY